MKCYIGYSKDQSIRYRATSGGVGTALIKWLFENGIIDTSISFDFDASTLKYTPKIIHSFSDYKISGSIYQEIDLIHFVKDNIGEIGNSFACFALPCQTRAIRAIVQKAGRKAFIIGLTCSSQQTLDATKYLLKRVRVNEDDVKDIKYRGNGWPSGIQIEKKDGEKVFVPNNGSIWTQIFHSRLFIRKKCLKCQDTLNRHSDVTLADPWLKEIIKDEQIGRTIIVCNTTQGEDAIKAMDGIFIEDLPSEKVELSQKGTIIRKQSYRAFPKFTDKIFKILSSKFYKKVALSHKVLFNIHYKVKCDIENYMNNRTMMKILITNQPINNRGDESAHKALVRKLISECPNIQITVLFFENMTTEKGIEEFKVVHPNVKYIRIEPKRGYGRFMNLGFKYNLYFLWRLHPTINRLTRIINGHDAVVCAPGGICMGGFQNWKHIFLLYIAKLCKKPIFYYGRSFGPFPTKTKSNRLFKKISFELLRYFSFISIRDAKTQFLAQEEGIKFVPTVDTAFLEMPRVAIPKEILADIQDAPYMVFVPNELVWHYAYKKYSIDNIKSFYLSLLYSIRKLFPDLRIVMLPQTFCYSNAVQNTGKRDVNFFRALAKTANDDRIVVVQDTYGSDIQQTIINGAKFVIGARYHSIVFAINNNVPFISLNYEHKMFGLLESLEKSDCGFDITNIFDSPEKIERLTHKIENRMLRLHDDIECQQKAKQMSLFSFNEFINTMNRVVSQK